jgi:hypothetical protein
MKRHIESRAAVTLDDEALTDVIRTRLVSGYERTAIPRELILRYGVDEAAIDRAFARLDQESALLTSETRRELLRATSVGVVVAAVVGGVIKLQGVGGVFVVGVSVAVFAAVVIGWKIVQMARTQDL